MILKREKVVNDESIRDIAKKYNTLDYFGKLVILLKKVYPLEEFDHLSKFELHRILNDTLIDNYRGEEIFKYQLFQNNIKKSNVIGAFEIKVNKSRVDFLTINGVSTSYEIKSELDNLSKLSKQMSDYLLVFEYNYLVLDDRHTEKAKDLIPDSFGLWSFKNGKFRKLKKATINNKIDPEIQLSLLTKKELVDSFPEYQGRLNSILDSYNINDINLQFKKTLKNRYRNRWDFLISNHESIFPIDIQFFFNTNIQPLHIYN